MYIFAKDETKEKIITALKSIDPELKVSSENFITTSKGIQAYISTQFNFDKMTNEWFIYVYQSSGTAEMIRIPLNDVHTVYDL